MTEPGKPEHEGSKELDRIVNFSDAIFAIAATLLVLDIPVPEIPENLVAAELPGRLLDLWPKFLSYAISFLVIIFYWMAHHSIFRDIRGYDRGLLLLNSLFLMWVAFLPFPTALLGEYEDQQLVVVIYAVSLAITRLLLTAVSWYATSGHRLVDPDLDLSAIRAYRIRGLAIPLVFLLSILISFLSVRAAVYSWVLLVVVDLMLLRVLRRRSEGTGR